MLIFVTSACLPQRRWRRPLSYRPGPTCFPPAAWRRFRRRSDRSHPSTVSRCRKTPGNIKTGHDGVDGGDADGGGGDVGYKRHDLLSDIIDDDDAVSSSVVAGGDGSKPLLTRRVPLRAQTKLTLKQILLFMVELLMFYNCQFTTIFRNENFSNPIVLQGQGGTL